jgi:NAD(P)-dependent dehydrogenase (short-subunit alcohol dehydrogenase family)
MTRVGRLDGKAIIVTGAARGIGRATAAACLAENAQVLLVDVDRAVVGAAEAMGGEALIADITAADSAARAMAAVMDRHGRLDGLVNNAGRVDEADILETSDRLWDDTLALNLAAPFRWSRAAIPLMMDTGGGSIVNISSIEAMHVRPRHFPYVVSKSGLNCLTRAIAVDFGRRGIRCNTISPGSVRTEMFDTYVAQYPGLEDRLLGLNYAGRLGTPEEIGQAAVYLLSDETRFLSGHDLVVDGARTVAT